jgi:hypothetical protein
MSLLINHCSRCGAFLGIFYFGPHRCPPRWEVCDPIDPDYWRVIYAGDEEEAAAKFCEREDRENNFVYSKEAGQVKDFEILVRADEDAEPVKVLVRIETTTEYTGRLRGESNGSL